MLFCIKVKPMHKEAESFSPMILLLLFPYYIHNCSEPSSKMLRISSVWHICQIDFYAARFPPIIPTVLITMFGKSNGRRPATN